MKRCKSVSAGFSLIEVLVALVILGVGLMGLARLQLFLLASTADTAAYDLAIRLASEQLESLRFKRLAGSTPTSGSDAQLVQAIHFERVWTVNCAPDQYCQARVVAQWHEPRGSTADQAREVTLEAYLWPSASLAQAWLVQSGAPGRETLP